LKGIAFGFSTFGLIDLVFGEKKEEEEEKELDSRKRQL
jgi:hypothetical protein